MYKNNRCSIVYLPIEFGSRELNGKALLANELLLRGFTVIIGQQWMIYQNLDLMPPGSIVIKSTNSIHEPAMIMDKKMGHKLFLQEEETLGHTNRKHISINIPTQTVNHADVFLANGEIEAELVKEKIANRQLDVQVTGNARVEVLKNHNHFLHDENIKSIQNKYGEYILINTNFGITNSIWGSIDKVTEIMIRSGVLNIKDPESIAMWEENIDFEVKNKEGIFKVIAGIKDKLPNTKIIIRPHPAESISKWNQFLSNDSNLSIIRQGDHVPWTLASKVLLHTSCTTGFEAFVAGKASFSLTPKECNLTNSFISNYVNPTFKEPYDMINATVNYINNLEAPKLSHFNHDEVVENIREKNGIKLIADLITDGQFGNKFNFPVLKKINRDSRLIDKFHLSKEQFTSLFNLITANVKANKSINIHELGDSLFAIVPSKK